jgi:hypothetical protein
MCGNDLPPPDIVGQVEHGGGQRRMRKRLEQAREEGLHRQFLLLKERRQRLHDVPLVAGRVIDQQVGKLLKLPPAAAKG